MPELPEVETTVRGLARFLDGARIERVVLNRPDLRRPFPQDLVQIMTGATVTGLSRRAKYGLIHLDRAQSVIFHLGMSGRWRIDPQEPEPHDHMLIKTAHNRFALCDPRR
ncbi:MAG: DNA-formamidopyrimidine glycosylase family protein, partial [Pseudomonadota bacterium]